VGTHITAADTWESTDHGNFFVPPTVSECGHVCATPPLQEDLILPDAEHVAEYAKRHGPPPPCGPLGMDWWEAREGEFCLESEWGQH
jgi:hypothetical protein